MSSENGNGTMPEMIVRAILCITFVVFFCALYGQAIDIADHPLPLADGFTDSASEGIFPNPALLTAYPNGWIGAEHERLFWGFGEPIQRSGLSAVYNSCCTGIGLFASMLSAPIEYRWSAQLAFTMRLHKALTTTIAEKHWGFFLGAGVGVLARGYNTSAMTLAEPDPLFTVASPSKPSKMGITASFGVAYRQKFGQVFAGAFNLTAPNLAIGTEPDRVMPAAQTGAMWRIGAGFLWAVAQYSPKYGNIWLDVDPAIGVAYRTTKYLSLQAFASSHSVGAGVVFTPTYDWGPAVVYRLSYPLDGLGIPTHRFGVQFRLHPPAPLFPDVKPLSWKIEGTPIPGETLNISLTVKNKGNFRTPDVPVFVRLGTGEVRKFSIGPIDVGGMDTVQFDFVARNAGDNEIYAVLNRKSPDLSAPPEFIEKNPDDNAATETIHIFAPPKAKLIVQRGELHLLQLFSVAEDEPLVPLFFFDQNDTSLDKRFNHTLEIIALRMRQNPDVELSVLGYVTADESAELAIGRANAVRSALLLMSGIQQKMAQRIQISTTHDFYRKRAQSEQFQGTRLGKKYIAQENRRAELYARIPESKITLPPDELPDDERIDRIETILARNPEVFLAVQATNITDALQYKQRLIGKISSEFSNRIFSQDGADTGIVLVLSAAGLLYRPQQVVQPKEGYEIEDGWDEVKLFVEAESEVPIKSSKIVVFRRSDTVAVFNGDSARWDWGISSQSVPPPGTDFTATAFVQDTFGRIAQSNTERLSVVVKNINDVKQRLILLQFAFAGERSESEFTNARMEFIARRVIQRIEAGNVDVIVAGNTDTIGTLSGNEKLSQRRADEQMEILRKYLRSLLQMDDSQIDEWIVRHNASLKAKGYGMSKPFTIIRLQGDEEIPVMVGDNTLPEGRIKNRRVEILFKPREQS